MKKHLVLLIAVVASFSFYGCSKDLSRGEAAKKISSKDLGEKGIIMRDLGHFDDNDWFTYIMQQYNLQDEGREFNAKLAEAQKRGIVEIKYKQMPGVTGEMLTYTLKDFESLKGDLFLINNNARIVLARKDSIEINGIQKISENERTVDISVKYKPSNPFGEVLLGKDIIKKGTAKFVLYDDGWRLNLPINIGIVRLENCRGILE